MKYLGKINEFFEVVDITSANCSILKESKESDLSLLWFTSDENLFSIDTVGYKFQKNEIICLTEFHQLDVEKVNSLKLLRFNRPFYCILDHDSEVGCKGILFFGAANLPRIKPSAEEIDILETVWKMLEIEMKSKDNLQLEMLQMMLKRILILCTRIYKKQEQFEEVATGKVDIIRDFNFLVEQHFRVKHSVAEYAALLNKSPKTLSNLFKKISNKSPLQIIQGRLMVEARRLLRHSDKTISEIAYEIGFSDIHSFSRFFKKKQGVSPKEFKTASV